MTTYSFQAVLKKHKHSARKIAARLQSLYDDVAVSQSAGTVRVTFKREADSFSSVVLMSIYQLTELGYAIQRIEVDGMELPLSSISDADLRVTRDFDLEDTSAES